MSPQDGLSATKPHGDFVTRALSLERWRRAW
jgi:hypothetical protein